MNQLFTEENVTITNEATMSSFKVEDLRGYCEKFDGKWYCASYIDHFSEGKEVRTIISISQGKKSKQVLRECMNNAVERIGGK